MKFFEFCGNFILDHTLIVVAILAVMNLIALAFYVSDKNKAKKGKWRIPEATLVGLAWLFGSVGALIGMYVFRHKTKHIKFVTLVPLAFVVQVAFFALSVYAAIK
ncbi:MAG: DUF1294 domain-containing protein [Clostridia bacterium]|nr:DUF1294 domain-containing protein [Clostridia bacterium]